MITRTILVSIVLLFYSFGLSASEKETFNIGACYDLIERMLPGYSKHFTIAAIQATEKKDYFEVESSDGKVVLRGNSPVAVASAFNYYLKNVANCQITWNGSNQNLSLPLPTVKEKIVKTTPYQYRYYLNYCTFNYTMSWWDWKRWEWEIDWMAMNGINTPLAVTGQNSIHRNVYRKNSFLINKISRK